MGTNIGEQFDITGLRYNRIIIMTDADVDGSHIRTLLLTFFYRYFPELVKQGHIYVAQPPLYAIRKGKNTQFAYTDEEKEKILKEFSKQKEDKKPVKTAKGKAIKESVSTEVEPVSDGAVDQTGVGENIAGVNIQRYKGLGEMNADQLWETTMNPETRIMNQVTVEDAEKADSTFSILMGAEVLPRKKFIQTHAQSVVNLDI
jgi:DNA gyrase subunit B